MGREGEWDHAEACGGYDAPQGSARLVMTFNGRTYLLPFVPGLHGLFPTPRRSKVVGKNRGNRAGAPRWGREPGTRQGGVRGAEMSERFVVEGDHLTTEDALIDPGLRRERKRVFK